ncbi:hypothetical protein [Baaleninema sp.]|uniref:hypothetical protein n=1 Tax=Baaleninema sp. TaxID=3101197 RepID=UPI003D041FF9
MTNSDNTQIPAFANNPKRFLEIQGAPGQLVRGTIVPNFGGKTTVRIEKDRLHEQAQIGSERRETFTPIAAVDYVGVYESSIGILLIVGLLSLMVGLGLILLDPLHFKTLAWGFCFGSIILTILYFFIKYKYLIIASQRNTIIVFCTKSAYEYRQFSITVLDVARELTGRPRTTSRKSPRSNPKPPSP